VANTVTKRLAARYYGLKEVPDDAQGSVRVCDVGRPGNHRWVGEYDVRRVAVFGNAGGGKSTLARKLADLTGLPLYPLDTIQYRAGGGEVPHEEYLRVHDQLLTREAWIIDGFGCAQSAWERFASADTLVYIDLPLMTHFLWVTKRLAKGLFVTPEGWPEGSPMFSSTISSYRVLRLCHRRLTPRYRQLVSEVRARKRVHHLKSAAEISMFLEEVTQEVRTAEAA
jgi:adenylate kinase family enzyme